MFKRYFTLLALLFCVIALKGQDCTSTWPYLYDDFMWGTVHYFKEAPSKYRVNIQLPENKLHFIEEDTHNIMQSDNSFNYVEIEGEKFYSRQGKILRCIVEHENGFIGEVTDIDWVRVHKEDDAITAFYKGDKSQEKIFAEDGIDYFYPNYDELLLIRHGGIRIPIKKYYYIVTSNGYVYPGDKSDFINLLPDDMKDEFEKFIKTNKVRWKKPEQIVDVLDFFQ